MQAVGLATVVFGLLDGAVVRVTIYGASRLRGPGFFILAGAAGETATIAVIPVSTIEVYGWLT